ncbi:MAG: hypothetical protein HC882_08150 [Acidobacteria bacterium]|nr:hypothetical protein [Acidobacteriota bacterium]
MTTTNRSIFPLAALAATLLAILLAPEAMAQNNTDLDLYAGIPWNVPNPYQKTALDIAWSDGGTLYAAYADQNTPTGGFARDDRFILRKRGPGDAAFSEVYLDYARGLLGLDSLHELAIALPAVTVNDNVYDRVFVLASGRPWIACAFSPSRCGDAQTVLVSFPMHAQGTLNRPVFHAWVTSSRAASIGTPLTTRPSITIAQNPALPRDYRVVAAVTRDVIPSANNVPDVFVAVYKDQGRTLEASADVATGATRPALTHDGAGSWLLAFERVDQGTTRVVEGEVRPVSGRPSIVTTELYETFSRCTHPAIDMDAGQYDLVCLGRAGVRGGSALEFHVGSPSLGTHRYQTTLDPECVGEPDIAVRADDASYTTARCWDASRAAFDVYAIETDRLGDVLIDDQTNQFLKARINDEPSTTIKPRAAANRGARTKWANRSTYGYATEKTPTWGYLPCPGGGWSLCWGITSVPLQRVIFIDP